VGVPSDGPRGAVVYIDNTVSMPSNFMSAYRTYINAVGIVDVGTSYGHRLGEVHGTGKLRLMSGDLPAGSYSDFFSTSGGTLEYSGTTDYDILSEITSLNHLIISGIGERSMPNINFQILGDLSITGADVINTHNRNMSVMGDIAFTGGSYEAGTTFGTRIPTLTMNGDVLQNISGTQHFSASNALYNFDINCAVGVNIENDVEVDNVLNLAQGVVYTDAGGSLTIMKSTADAFMGGSNTAYVQGALRKNIVGGDSFIFPLGDATRYGELTVSPDATSSGIWSARYHNTNPLNGGFDPDVLVAPVQYVSHNEYWDVQAPSVGLKANVLMRWDSNSGVNPNTDFRVVNWTVGVPNAWDQLTIGTKTGDALGGTVNLNSDLTFGFNGTANHYLTFASILIPAFQWEGGISGDWFDPNNWSGTLVPDGSANITINNTGAAPYINSTALGQVNDLTINHVGGLSMQPGSQLMVNGNLSTNDYFTIENTCENPSSLITHGTVTGNVSIQWAYLNVRWWFVGHSISNPQMDSYRQILIDDPTNQYAMYDYKDPGTLVKISADGLYNFAANDQLRGYQLKVLKTGTVVKHVGVLNNATSYEKDVQTGWQIIANPYASYYQLPTDASGTGDFANTIGSAYITVATTNHDKSYETFNTNSGVGSPSTFNGIIAPSQAFYIKTIDAPNPSDKIYMRAANQVHDGNRSSLKSAKASNKDLIRIKMINEHKSEDEAVIAFRPYGKVGFTRMDSEQLIYPNNKVSYIYSMVEGIKAVINVLPDTLKNYKQPMGLRLKKGWHSIHIDGLDEINETYNVILEDMVAKTRIPMKKKTVYKFESKAGTFNERLVLHFEEIDVPTNSMEVISEATGVGVYINNRSTLMVSCNWKAKEKVVNVYSITGKLVYSEVFEGEQFTKELNLPSGVYIVKVSSADKTYETKVMVR